MKDLLFGFFGSIGVTILYLISFTVFSTLALIPVILGFVFAKDIVNEILSAFGHAII